MRDAEWRRPPGSRTGGGRRHDRRRGRWQGVPRGGWGGWREGTSIWLRPQGLTISSLRFGARGGGRGSLASVTGCSIAGCLPALRAGDRPPGSKKKKKGEILSEKLVCQAGVALGALGRTSEGHSERCIQNSNCLCDRGRRGGRGRCGRERFLLFFREISGKRKDSSRG